MFGRTKKNHICTDHNVKLYEEAEREIESKTRRRIFSTITTFVTGAFVGVIAINHINKNK